MAASGILCMDNQTSLITSAGNQILQRAARAAAARQDKAMATPGLPETKSGHSCPKVKSSNRHESTVKDAAHTYLPRVIGANFCHYGRG